MAAANLSAFLYGKMDLRLEESPMPQPAPNEVLIEMKACGVCGTDIHMWQNGSCGDFKIVDPVVIGHETSGLVIGRGSQVTDLQIGDRVALELGLPCRICEFCKLGKYNLCKPFSLGGLTRYHCYPSDFCHKLPDNVGYEAGALIEPLAVAVRAVQRAGVLPATTVLVCGAGAIGLLVMLVAKARGVSKICITDISEERLIKAKEMGAEVTIKVTPGEDAKKLAERIEAVLGSKAAYTIECTGVESSLRAAIFATRSGGVMTAVGLGDVDVTLPLVDAMVREVDIRGVFSYCNDYPTAISLVASGKVDPTPMISHRFTLGETLATFQLVKSQQKGVLKVIINCAD